MTKQTKQTKQTRIKAVMDSSKELQTLINKQRNKRLTNQEIEALGKLETLLKRWKESRLEKIQEEEDYESIKKNTVFPAIHAHRNIFY